MVPARRCSQPFDKNAGAVRRPRHFDSINSNFQRQPQRWVYQCRLASAVQKPPPSGLLSQTGHSSYEGYGHPGNVLLSSGLRLSKFNLTRWVAYPFMPHAGAQGAASRADDALLVHWAAMLQMGRRSSPQVGFWEIDQPTAIDTSSCRSAMRSAPSGAGTLGDLRQGAQRGVHRSRIRKQAGNLGVNDDDVGTRLQSLDVFPAHQRSEIRAFIFGTQFVRGKLLSLPHRASFLPALRGER